MKSANSLSQYAKDVIHKAMETISAETCIKFHPKTDKDKNGIEFFKGGE